MRQVIQHLNTGETTLVEVPAPACGRGMLLIQTRRSLISAGTERMLVEFSKSGLLAKARSQPEKVKQVLDKIRTEGLLPTLEKVFSRLNEPLPLGYCNAGEVLETGAGVTEYRVGDRVASAGRHAEIVCVPKHLCARIPENVSDDDAAFTVLASIALQGIRLVQPTLGERFVVFGAGLIGLVTVQLLRASGCHVLAIDIDEQRLALAEEFGADVCRATACDPVSMAQSWSAGFGVDAVLITASAKTDDIVRQAAEMSRKRGRIVLVGVVGLNLRRADFYEKELTFQVSCSYGPGRYDSTYEQGGQDYPLAYVRWTEQRNFEAVLSMMASGRLCVDKLITHRVPLGEALRAYEVIQKEPQSLGVVLQYPETVPRESSVRIARPSSEQSPRRRTRDTPAGDRAVVGVIGAGNFSKMTLMPALAKTPARIKYVCSRGGVSARHVAARFGGENAVTDYRRILDDSEVNGVLISVQHNLHAVMAMDALSAGKHVFLEKPLCLNEDELHALTKVVHERGPASLTVGFNRRFSPHVLAIRHAVRNRAEPLAMTMTMNAGAIPASHWVQDAERGGGRIVGEVCHLIDLMVYLTGQKVQVVAAQAFGRGAVVLEDKASIILRFADGSVGNINYFANGSKAFPKEMLQVFSDGRVFDMQNFRRTRAYGATGFRNVHTWRQDKGHTTEFARWVQFVEMGGEALVPYDEAVNVTLASFAAVRATKELRTVNVGPA